MWGALTSGLFSRGHSPASIFAISAANVDHGVAEAVDLLQRFRLGRLDHQRACHRKAHGRCMEAVVNQSFRDIIHSDATDLGQWAQIKNAFVGDPSVAPGVQHWIVIMESFCDVVRRK